MQLFISSEILPLFIGFSWWKTLQAPTASLHKPSSQLASVELSLISNWFISIFPCLFHVALSNTYKEVYRLV